MSLWTAEKLATHFFPSVYLLEPICPKGGIIFMYGKRGIGKSHFAMSLTYCLAKRGALFGRYPIHQSGPVVYISADMSEVQVQPRLKKASKAYGYPNAYFYFPPFMNILSLTPDNPIVQEINALHPCLIVWDTLRKCFRGSTNDDDSPSYVYTHSKFLFPGVTHLFIHHDKKTVVDQTELEEDELFRGSGAWIDDCDLGIHLVELAPRRLRASFTKVKDAEDQLPIQLTLDVDQLLLYADAEQLPMLAEWWMSCHPTAHTDDLEKYLLNSFVGGPQVVKHYVQGVQSAGIRRIQVPHLTIA